jgi:mono/diheme cytochrome c family protein
MSEPTDRVPDRDLRDTTDVPQMMSRLYREHDEPRDGFEPVPVWMAALFGLLIFWAGWYMASHSGGYTAASLDLANPNEAPNPGSEPQTPEQTLALGTRLYAHCVVCHQTDGNGVEGIHPPLRKADWLLADPTTPERLAKLLIHGGSGEWIVNGQKYTAPMPAYGSWKDHEIAAVLSFVRQAWGNGAGPVTTADVAAARLATKGRPANGSKGWTQAELQK